MVVNGYKQLPRKSVHWRWAAREIVRCLGGAHGLEARFAGTEERCPPEDFEAMQRFFNSVPGTQPMSPRGDCWCPPTVYLGQEPLLTPTQLRKFDPASPDRRRAPADLGFGANLPAGCVGFWLDIVQWLAFGEDDAQREGRSGQPGTPWNLRGALNVLARKINSARIESDVVSPETCIALMLFFQVFSNGSRGRNRALPRLVQRGGVATAESLRALRKSVHDLTRSEW
jgi:hypothetical protein